MIPPLIFNSCYNKGAKPTTEDRLSDLQDNKSQHLLRLLALSLLLKSNLQVSLNPLRIIIQAIKENPLSTYRCFVFLFGLEVAVIRERTTLKASIRMGATKAIIDTYLAI